MNLLAQFQRFIVENELFKSDERVLLAVSGGVDSVVMAYLFRQSGFLFGIAHCNFQLRGTDSYADEQFVQKLAGTLGAPYFSSTFDTVVFAQEHRLSIQMAARELRYHWLESICREQDFQHIATAHHLNDTIETFLYNFAKGAGIRGLQGIPVRNGRVIRPLLFAAKADIIAFAKAENITYREDASNKETKYARNKIRHHVLPALETLNPNFTATATDNFRHLQAAGWLYEWAVSQIRQEALSETGDEWRIDRAKLADYHSVASTLLYEWLQPLGFNTDQTRQMLQAVVGAIFYSATHRLTADRMHFIVQKRPDNTLPEQFVLPAGVPEIDLSVAKITFTYQTGRPETFSNDPFIVYLNAEKLIFPLTLRRWQPGDFFYPLGLSGNRQKLQDFFTNQKLSRFEKEQVWILTSADGAVCWVVGYRPDERFKITPDTTAYWMIHFQKR